MARDQQRLGLALHDLVVVVLLVMVLHRMLARMSGLPGRMRGRLVGHQWTGSPLILASLAALALVMMSGFCIRTIERADSRALSMMSLIFPAWTCFGIDE